ncbi:MAG: type I methionyl aminopeptidase [Oscillospiraceae bacterium]|nr:type I methionyl aminopeptidase [Oscillospiraceae bacterium]
MISLKTAREISLMQDAGTIAATALKLTGQAVKPGITTLELNRIAHDYITKQGAYPTFLHYNGFPMSACISVNDEVIHGIPSAKRLLREGDIVSIDLGATYKGYVGDTAATFYAGKVSLQAEALCDTTKQALYIGIEAAVPGAHIGDIGAAVQTHCEARGYSLVTEYTGHGVGRQLHEDPSVPNTGKRGHGALLRPGMTIAIEPMVNAGKHQVKVLPDRWTVKTRDRSLSAHFEHTIAITSDGHRILTQI